MYVCYQLIYIHGVNSVNFAILALFGYQFAPRNAKFKHAFHDLFEIELGETLLLKLRRPFNISLIKREWENIQRTICPLSRKRRHKGRQLPRSIMANKTVTCELYLESMTESLSALYTRLC